MHTSTSGSPSTVKFSELPMGEIASTEPGLLMPV